MGGTIIAAFSMHVGGGKLVEDRQITTLDEINRVRQEATSII
jgi:hypothetical protein